MDYLTPTLGDPNTILLPKLLDGPIFDFKYGFLQMLENLRKFIKFTNTVRQNRVWTTYIRLYNFPFFLNGKAWDWLC